jgi:hypothetical protein
MKHVLAQLVEVNTGGRVYFCVFKPSSSPLKQATYRRTLSDDADAQARASSIPATDALLEPRSSSYGTSTQATSTAAGSPLAAASSADKSSGEDTSTATRAIARSTSQALERYLETAVAGYGDDPGPNPSLTIAQAQPPATLPGLVQSVGAYPSTPLVKDQASGRHSDELLQQQQQQEGQGATGEVPWPQQLIGPSNQQPVAWRLRITAYDWQGAQDLSHYLNDQLYTHPPTHPPTRPPVISASVRSLQGCQHTRPSRTSSTLRANDPLLRRHHTPA